MRPVVGEHAIAGFDGELLFARKSRRKIKRLPGLLLGGGVKAKRGPGVGKRGVRGSILGIGGDGFCEQVASGLGFKHSQLVESLGIVASGLRIGGKSGAGLGLFAGTEIAGTQLGAHRRACAGYQVKQVGLTASLGVGTDRLAVAGVLQTQIEADFAASGIGHNCVRAEDHHVGAKIMVQALQNIAGQSLRVLDAQSQAGLSDILTGNQAEFAAGGKLGDEHFGKRSGEPRLVGLAGEVLEAEHGDRAARMDGGAARCQPAGHQVISEGQQGKNRGNGQKAQPERERMPGSSGRNRHGRRAILGSIGLGGQWRRKRGRREGDRIHRWDRSDRWRGSDGRNRDYDAIAATSHGFDIAGLGGIIAKGNAKAVHGGRDSMIKINERVGGPQAGT